MMMTKLLAVFCGLIGVICFVAGTTTLSANDIHINQHLKNEAINATDGKFERTLVLIKPESIHRGLIGQIIDRFEKRGLKLVALKFIWPTKEQIQNHYEELVHREYYSRLVEQMISGPIMPIVWEGINSVKIVYRMKGASEPILAAPGTIRGDFCIDSERTVIHASHSVEAANKEIRLWFQENELISWTSANDNWIHGKNL